MPKVKRVKKAKVCKETISKKIENLDLLVKLYDEIDKTTESLRKTIVDKYDEIENYFDYLAKLPFYKKSYKNFSELDNKIKDYYILRINLLDTENKILREFISSEF